MITRGLAVHGEIQDIYGMEHVFCPRQGSFLQQRRPVLLVGANWYETVRVLPLNRPLLRSEEGI